MSKQILVFSNPPTLTPGPANTGTINFGLAVFNNSTSFDVRNLYAIINVKTQQIVYAIGLAGYGYSAYASQQLTLQQDTTGMSVSDLSILYELQDTGAASDAVASTDTGTASLIALTKRLLTKVALGVSPQASSQAVTQASEYITGASNQSAATVNIAASAGGSSPIDVLGYKTLSIQIVTSATTTTITGGVITFEGSNDGVNFLPIAAQDASTLAAVPTYTYTVAMGSKMFDIPILYRYFKARISTAITGTGSLVGIQAYTTLSHTPCIGSTVPVAQVSELVTGASAQTVGGASGVGINIVQPVSGTAGYDVLAYKSIAIQIIGAAGVTAGGVVTFEVSNDNVNFIAIPVVDPTTLTATPATTYSVPAGASSKIFNIPVLYRYFRARISTTVPGTGGIQAFTTLSHVPLSNTTMQVYQPTLGSLNATVNVSQLGGAAVSSTAGAGGTNRMLGTIAANPITNVDRTSTATSTTGVSPVITSDLGASISGLINVTAVSGTSPTLDLVLQESRDNGTTWTDIYHVQRISAVSTIDIPHMIMSGRRRWSWTVGGTATPTITFTTTTMQGSGSPVLLRSFYDRTANVLNATLNTPGTAFNIEGCKNITMFISSGITTTGGTFVAQISPDGITWANTSLSIATATVASGSAGYVASISNLNAKFIRVIVSVAGTSQALNYVHFEASNL
jgi:hypothetical protein